VNGAIKQLPSWIDKLNAFTQQHFNTTVVSASSLREPSQAVGNATKYLQQHAGDVLGAVGNLLGAVFGLLTVGLFTFYLTANGPQVRRALLSRMPPERQQRVLWAWNTAIEKTGGYLYSNLLLTLINGGLMLVTLLLGFRTRCRWRCSSAWSPSSSRSWAPMSPGRSRCWWRWPRWGSGQP
jgi:predicted PurR-regulated permease PerM